MSITEKLHLSFHYQGADYDVDLIKGEKSPNSIELNGVTYKVIADKETTTFACKVLNSIAITEKDWTLTKAEPKAELSQEDRSSFPVQRTDQIGITTLAITGKHEKTQIKPKVDEGDDLFRHQNRIDTIQERFSDAYDAQQAFSEISGKLMSAHEESTALPRLNNIMEKLTETIDAARSQAIRGEFDLAEETCLKALTTFQQNIGSLEKEIFDCFDKDFSNNNALKNSLEGLFNQAKGIIKESLTLAQEGCKDCSKYLAELNKEASVELTVVEKELREAAFDELSKTRKTLQKIWDGEEEGSLAEAKDKVSKAMSRCYDLSWIPENAKIAKKQRVEKAQLAASFIPKATAEKVVQLATETFGTPEKPGKVLLKGIEFEVAHGLSKEGYQVIQLPLKEVVLGKGAWNAVSRVVNVSRKCFQALRKPITPPGEMLPGEEHILGSIQIYKDINKLEGTTVGPEALIRKGVGGVLSSLYNDDVIKWLHMIPPPELRWECFKSTLSSFIEFAKDGNVHGDIHPGNLSVVYNKKRTDKEGVPIYAAPETIKIEDLDGACHIIEAYDKDGIPIYSKKAADVGIVCKFATQSEVDEWVKCNASKDISGIAKVRFGQDIFAMGITLYQMLTLDFDLDNLYLNKKCAPFTDNQGRVVPDKFEEGIFLAGEPNVDYIRFALEKYQFLNTEQKEKIIRLIVLATSQNTENRAKLQDFETAINI